MLLEGDPHAVIEGMLIAAFATGPSAWAHQVPLSGLQPVGGGPLAFATGLASRWRPLGSSSTARGVSR